MRKSRPRPNSKAKEKKEKMPGLPLHTARVIRSVLRLFTRTEREDYGRGTAYTGRTLKAVQQNEVKYLGQKLI